MTSNSISQGGPVKITIKKGEGITYALKRLVEQQKMKLSDGKITAQEWNATMDKLAEIQQSRLSSQNGGKSIFSGNMDKTRAGWHNSFVVHEGQEIEFTKEEIAALYKAMGASYTEESTQAAGASSTNKGENKAPVNKQASADNEKQSQKIVKEEIQTDKEGKKYTASLDASGNVVKKTYKRADGTIDKVLDYNKEGNNTKCTEYNNDGKTIKYTSEYKYDSNGKHVQTIQKRSDGKLDRVMNYKDGKIMRETTYDENGKIVKNTFDYKYDENGEISKTICKRGDGTLECVFDYEDDKLIRTTTYDENGKIVKNTFDYKYDENDNISKETCKRKDGTLEHVYDYKDGKDLKDTYYKEDGKTINYTRDYEYDTNGEKSKVTNRRADGSLIGEFDYKDGEIVKETHYEKDGRTVNKLIENGTLKQLRLKSKTESGSTVSYNYNFSDGVCVKSDLADLIHNQISGASLNKNTIALLKQLSPENIIKVLTSYEQTYGTKLEDDINDEWGLGKEEIEKYITAALNERKNQLKAPDNISFEELIKLDTKNS